MGSFSSLIKKKPYYKLYGDKKVNFIPDASGSTGSNLDFFQTDEILAKGLNKNGISLSDKPMRRIAGQKLYSSLINPTAPVGASNIFFIEKGLAFQPGQYVCIIEGTTQRPSSQWQTIFNDPDKWPTLYEEFVDKLDIPSIIYPLKINSYDSFTGKIVFDGAITPPRYVMSRVYLIKKQQIFLGPYSYISRFLIYNDLDFYFFSSIDSEPTFLDENNNLKKIGFNYLFLRPDSGIWELGRCKIQGETDPLWIKLASNEEKLINETHNLDTEFYSDAANFYGSATNNLDPMPIDINFFNKNFKLGDLILITCLTGTNQGNFGVYKIIEFDKTSNNWDYPAYSNTIKKYKTLKLKRAVGDGDLIVGNAAPGTNGSLANFSIEKLSSSFNYDNLPKEEDWVLESQVVGKLKFFDSKNKKAEGKLISNSKSILNTSKSKKIIYGPTGLGDFSNFPGLGQTGSTGQTGPTGQIYIYESETLYYCSLAGVSNEVEKYKIDQFIKGLKSLIGDNGQTLWDSSVFVLLNSRQNRLLITEAFALGGVVGGVSSVGFYGNSLGYYGAQYRSFPTNVYESYEHGDVWSSLKTYANTAFNSIFVRPKTFFMTYRARDLYPNNFYGQKIYGSQSLFKSSNIDYYIGGAQDGSSSNLKIFIRIDGTDSLYTLGGPFLDPGIPYGSYNQYNWPWRIFGYSIKENQPNEIVRRVSYIQLGFSLSSAPVFAGLYENLNASPTLTVASLSDPSNNFAYLNTLYYYGWVPINLGFGNTQQAVSLNSAILPSEQSFLANGPGANTSFLFFSNSSINEVTWKSLANLFKNTVGSLNGDPYYDINTGAIKMYGFE